ncbi:hypothetical protein POL68_15445 [Stigmatella sp. ncwal1]|uniref:Farnesoic acid O-methyl transferase domain-containing protein n=1 Tax=Stigmatella ashevillensis TaxID=2995309 RepID=A0ABT5D880_9BACT|nr:hypothetical protein [Stigmatella ashevillena]MDC0709867.1 hypothetical protein [Stigmatella ashevillena]
MGQARRKEKEKKSGKVSESAPEQAPEKEESAEASPPAEQASAPAEPAPAPPAAWVKPEGLSKRGWALLAATLLLTQLPLLHYALARGQASVTAQIPYQQNFSSPSVVESDFFSTGAYWRVVEGQLLGPAPKNNPLWLQARLPDDVALEFDVRSEYPEGDIRLELFGDGVSPASGYVLVQGGWNNTLSVIARRDINAPPLSTLQRQAARIASQQKLPSTDLVDTGQFRKDTRVRVEASGAPVQASRVYHWRVERRGTLLRWSIDGQPVLELDDPFPLKGPGHDRLGFSGWESMLFFDNLRIVPLDGSAAEAALPPPPPPPAPGPFADTFDRDTLGDAWNVTNPSAVKLENGALTVQLVHNKPVWLKQPIPTQATIDFDVWTDDPAGDIKVEAWGDGRSFYSGDLRLQYTASGYVFIFGGWQNTQSAIARQNEHTPDRAVKDGKAVLPGKRYHFTITRRNGTIDWSIDGQPFLSLKDSVPLLGPRQQYFGFSGWKTKVHFDNLKIQPL